AGFALGRLARAYWRATRWTGLRLRPLRLFLPARSGVREPVVILRTPAARDGIPIKHADPAATPTLESPASSSAETDPDISTPPPINRPAPMPEEERFADFELPPLTLLEDPEPFPYQEHDERLRERAALLEQTFTDFGLNVRVVGINTGPVITQYELALETGLRLHKVTRLADDLALNLRVPSVRMVA